MVQASKKIPFEIQPYYTPKTLEFQAFFAFIMFFVNYALNLCQQFYVNF